MAYRARSGYCGGSLSCAEILVVLYRGFLSVYPKNPNWDQRDRVILSKGHAARALYAMLARIEFFPEEDLKSLGQLGSSLQGHPDMRNVPGVEISTGSLGMGISNGIGMAWALRYKNSAARVFVIVGDGELNEGQNWEAAMLAAKLKLPNLVVIVDWNGVQLDGTIDEIMPLGDLSEKFRAFRWDTHCCDGHDCKSLHEALKQGINANRPDRSSHR
jgi:transketolase